MIVDDDNDILETKRIFFNKMDTRQKLPKQEKKPSHKAKTTLDI